MNKTQALIIDLDGTIALRGDRSPFDFENVDKDSLNKKLLEVISAIKQFKKDINIVFISGRMSSCREKTLNWLTINCDAILSLPITLHMRIDDDFRDDSVVKLDLYKTLIEPYYDVYLVFDDRNSVVDMWRSQGLICYQVADGDF